MQKSVKSIRAISSKQIKTIDKYTEELDDQKDIGIVDMNASEIKLNVDNQS